jgi:hypothetical protein
MSAVCSSVDRIDTTRGEPIESNNNAMDAAARPPMTTLELRLWTDSDSYHSSPDIIDASAVKPHVKQNQIPEPDQSGPKRLKPRVQSEPSAFRRDSSFGKWGSFKQQLSHRSSSFKDTNDALTSALVAANQADIGLPWGHLISLLIQDLFFLPMVSMSAVVFAVLTVFGTMRYLVLRAVHSLSCSSRAKPRLMLYHKSNVINPAEVVILENSFPFDLFSRARVTRGTFCSVCGGFAIWIGLSNSVHICYLSEVLLPAFAAAFALSATPQLAKRLKQLKLKCIKFKFQEATQSGLGKALHQLELKGFVLGLGECTAKDWRYKTPDATLADMTCSLFIAAARASLPAILRGIHDNSLPVFYHENWMQIEKWVTVLNMTIPVFGVYSLHRMLTSAHVSSNCNRNNYLIFSACHSLDCLEEIHQKVCVRQYGHAKSQLARDCKGCKQFPRVDFW